MHKYNVLAMVLAGGEGKRLFPLTKERAKPAVPFGGRYRIIDFVLSNLVNSGILKIKVLTQYKANSLINHIYRTWSIPSYLGYIDIVPPQMRVGKFWFRGTADAIYQNLGLIFDEQPDFVLVFSGDHIYKMDVNQMIDFHIKKSADITISAVPVDIKEASRYGIIQIDENYRIIGFQEKPENPIPMPQDKSKALVSMGNYVFNREVLIKEVLEDAAEDLNVSSHDFGKDILPKVYKKLRVYAYDFRQNRVPGITNTEIGYWRDVGTIDSYWCANMDLIAISPVFNLYNYNWPIRTYHPPYPPAKFVFSDWYNNRVGLATNSLIGEGVIISGGRINHSIISPGVRINSFSYIEDSIIMDGVEVGKYVKIKNAIIDKGVKIPNYYEIGYNLQEDKKKFFVSESGIVVIAKGTIL